MEIPDETDRLRQQAQRALRLARGITDDRAAQALKAYATSLFETGNEPGTPDVPLRASITEQQPVQQHRLSQETETRKHRPPQWAASED
jgi:hypothetical protein